MLPPTRAMALVTWLAACAAMLPGVARADAATPTKLLVVPVRRGITVDAALAAARRAGFAPLSLLADTAFVQAADAALADERARAGGVQEGLERAQAAWLAQRYDDMLAGLTQLEADELPVLARAEHAGTLWELEFQRGLAHLSRQAAGDAEEARHRFLIALELDPSRRPAREVYGPGVVEAFALAAVEQSRRAARPVTLSLTPDDALLVIDGVPVLDPGRTRLLRQGPHVVLASAPGHATAARLIELEGDAPLAITLAPIEGVAPAATLAPWWQSGQLRVDAPSTRPLVLALARSHGALVVLLVDDGEAGVRTRVLTADAASDWMPGQAALDRIDAEGHLLTETAAAPARPPRSVWRNPWLWSGIGAAVVGAVILGVVLLEPDAPPAHLLVGFE